MTKKEKTKVSWYDTNKDFEEEIHTSIVCEHKDINNVLDVIKIRQTKGNNDE